MVNFKHIESAHHRISDYIHNTPIFTCENINTETSANLFFKCDNFQKTGSFKIPPSLFTINTYLHCPIDNFERSLGVNN